MKISHMRIFSGQLNSINISFSYSESNVEPINHIYETHRLHTSCCTKYYNCVVVRCFESEVHVIMLQRQQYKTLFLNIFRTGSWYLELIHIRYASRHLELYFKWQSIPWMTSENSACVNFKRIILHFTKSILSWAAHHTWVLKHLLKVLHKIKNVHHCWTFKCVCWSFFCTG